MSGSSIASAKVFVPRISISRFELVLWLLQCAIAVGALAWSGVPGYVKYPGLLLACVTAACVRPRRCPVFSVGGHRDWSIPAEGLAGLELLADSTYTQAWAQLRFGRAGRIWRSICVWRDMFDANDWRQLQVRLREYHSR